jgi:hypothetical protein
VSGSFVLIHRARTSRFLLSSQTKPFRPIKNALLRPARRAFHTDGIPLRPLSKQAWCSAGAHSCCRRAAPSTSAIHAARVALHHRPWRSVLPPLPSNNHLNTNPPCKQARSSCHSPHAQARSTTSPSSSISAPARRARRAAAASGRTCPRDARCAGHSPPLLLRPPVPPVPPRRQAVPRRCGARSRAAMRTRAPRARRRSRSRCQPVRCSAR